MNVFGLALMLETKDLIQRLKPSTYSNVVKTTEQISENTL